MKLLRNNQIRWRVWDTGERIWERRWSFSFSLCHKPFFIASLNNTTVPFRVCMSLFSLKHYWSRCVVQSEQETWRKKTNCVHWAGIWVIAPLCSVLLWISIERAKLEPQELRAAKWTATEKPHRELLRCSLWTTQRKRDQALSVWKWTGPSKVQQGGLSFHKVCRRLKFL